MEAWLELVGAGLNRLVLVLCFGGVDRRLVLWVDFGVLAGLSFNFMVVVGNAGFVVVVLWLFATVISNRL